MKPLAKWFGIYAAKLVAIYTLLYFVYILIGSFNGFYLIEVFEATLVYLVVSVFYPGMAVSGNVLYNLFVAGNYSAFSIIIDDICVGWFPIAGFVSIILAIPYIPKEKVMKSLAFGVSVIFAANILRLIVILFVAALYGMDGFNYFHLFVVKFDLMLVMFLAFLVSVKFIIGRKTMFESVKSFCIKNSRVSRM